MRRTKWLAGDDRPNRAADREDAVVSKRHRKQRKNGEDRRPLVRQATGEPWTGEPSLIAEPGIGWHNPCGPATLLWVVDRPTPDEIAGCRAESSIELAVVPYGPLVVLLARPERGWPWQEMMWTALPGTEDLPPPTEPTLTPRATVATVLTLVDWSTSRVLVQRLLSPEPHVALAIWDECGRRLAGPPTDPAVFAVAAEDYKRTHARPEDALPLAVSRGWTGARGIAESIHRLELE
jgi:hypothetical protein